MDMQLGASTRRRGPHWTGSTRERGRSRGARTENASESAGEVDEGEDCTRGDAESVAHSRKLHRAPSTPSPPAVAAMSAISVSRRSLRKAASPDPAHSLPGADTCASHVQSTRVQLAVCFKTGARRGGGSGGSTSTAPRRGRGSAPKNARRTVAYQVHSSRRLERALTLAKQHKGGRGKRGGDSSWRGARSDVSGNQAKSEVTARQPASAQSCRKEDWRYADSITRHEMTGLTKKRGRPGTDATMEETREGDAKGRA